MSNPDLSGPASAAAAEADAPDPSPERGPPLTSSRRTAAEGDAPTPSPGGPLKTSSRSNSRVYFSMDAEHLRADSTAHWPATIQRRLIPIDGISFLSGEKPTARPANINFGLLLPPYVPAPVPVAIKRVPAVPPVLHLIDVMAQKKTHPNVMMFMGAVHLPRDGSLLMLYERLEVDLLDSVVGDFPRLCARERLEFSIQAARGLAHTHAVELTHGDVKPENLLCSATGRVKLCDFGLVKPAGAAPDAAYYGTLPYSAPELFPGEGFTGRAPAADVWAFGCTLLAFFTGRVPFDAELAELAGKQLVCCTQSLAGRTVREGAVEEWGAITSLWSHSDKKRRVNFVNKSF